jgi:hypothetical protein
MKFLQKETARVKRRRNEGDGGGLEKGIRGSSRK